MGPQGSVTMNVSVYVVVLIVCDTSISIISLSSHSSWELLSCFLGAEFQSGALDLYLEAASKADRESWAVALGEVNSEGLRNKIQQLRRLIMEIKEERSSDEARQFLPSSQLDSLGEPQFTSKCMYSFHEGVQ